MKMRGSPHYDGRREKFTFAPRAISARDISRHGHAACATPSGIDIWESYAASGIHQGPCSQYASVSLASTRENNLLAVPPVMQIACAAQMNMMRSTLMRPRRSVYLRSPSRRPARFGRPLSRRHFYKAMPSRATSPTRPIDAAMPAMMRALIA